MGSGGQEQGKREEEQKSGISTVLREEEDKQVLLSLCLLWGALGSVVMGYLGSGKRVERLFFCCLV